MSITAQDVIETARQVQEYRELLQANKEKLSEAHRKFDEDYGELMQHVHDLDQDLEEYESALREEALEWHTAQPDEELPVGLSIRNNVLVDYDPVHAVEWARVHDIALFPATLNKATFHILMKSMAPEERPTFVRILTKATVLIPSKLKAHLPAEEAPPA